MNEDILRRSMMLTLSGGTGFVVGQWSYPIETTKATETVDNIVKFKADYITPHLNDAPLVFAFVDNNQTYGHYGSLALYINGVLYNASRDGYSSQVPNDIADLDFYLAAGSVVKVIALDVQLNK